MQTDARSRPKKWRWLLSKKQQWRFQRMLAGIHAARRVVERIVSEGETVYGINTGFGALVHERISADDLAQLQVNLIGPATAIGELMSVEAVRAMMLIRLNSLCKGHSGIHPDYCRQLVLYLNQGIHPAVPRIGSLGASGDLLRCHILHWH